MLVLTVYSGSACSGQEGTLQVTFVWGGTV